MFSLFLFFISFLLFFYFVFFNAFSFAKWCKSKIEMTTAISDPVVRRSMLRSLNFRMNSCPKHQTLIVRIHIHFFRNFQRSPKWAFRLDGKRIFTCWWFQKRRVCACIVNLNIVLLSKVTNGTAGIAVQKKRVIDSTAVRTKTKS